MRTIGKLTCAALVALTFAACSSSSATPTAAPATTATPAPSAAKTLTIAYEESAQVELIAPSGERLLIDVADPTALTSEARASDVLLTTHLHTDHYSEAFSSSFPGKQVLNKTGEFTFGDAKVVSIAASHDDTAIIPDDPTNHIFVIDFAGFKIVHMGSTGQLQLTPEQLAAIGSNVDVAIGALQNVGGQDPTGTKPIDIVNQIKPRIFIPTHTALEYVQAAGKQWDATWSSKKTVTISKAELPSKTMLLCLGNVAPSYGAILKAPESKW